ncbi:MAG: hypothetical protein QM734_03705 [Cyclobacteriaceae bacterium]
MKVLKNGKKKSRSKIEFIEQLEPSEQLKIISSAYRIFVDSSEIKNIQWIVTQEVRFANLELTKLVTLIDISNLEKGSHTIFVKIKTKQEGYDTKLEDKRGNYYAKAYFLIDK